MLLASSYRLFHLDPKQCRHTTANWNCRITMQSL